MTVEDRTSDAPPAWLCRQAPPVQLRIVRRAGVRLRDIGDTVGRPDAPQRIVVQLVDGGCTSSESANGARDSV